ncbi:MAG TPA: molybdate ABC transporter permease subunit [Candidatus Saccharimonadales bacterium]|nr:molybdate ABC transporter permease subunit [Candidatus Saccharimonadales bacterium]
MADLLTPELWQALMLTLRLAVTVTFFLLLLSVPLAWWISNSRSRAIVLIETLVSLPIVLPPTVLGFYLLTLFSPEQPAGRLWFRIAGDTLSFTFAGLVFGSILYSLPYAVQPLVAAFRSVPGLYLDASTNLGASGWRTFLRIMLPLSQRGLGVAAMLSFAHTVGEFGVVVMIGGSIPGKTRVASIALYDEVQKLNYPAAHRFSILLLLVSFIMLLLINLMQQRSKHALNGRVA